MQASREAVGETSTASRSLSRPLRVLEALASSGTARQFVRYLLVGALAWGVDVTCLYLLTELAHLHYLASAVPAFLLGLATNYALSRLWVFAQRAIKSTSVEFLVFAAVGVVGLGLNELTLWFFGEYAQLHYLSAKVVSSGFVLVWNFGARKFLLFSDDAARRFGNLGGPPQHYLSATPPFDVPLHRPCAADETFDRVGRPQRLRCLHKG